MIKPVRPPADKDPPAARILSNDEAVSHSRRMLGRAKKLVEMCGRHPFATGIFAILGVIGLIFSFIAFGLDQADSQADQRSTTDIKRSLGIIEQVVTKKIDEPEPVWSDPLEIPELSCCGGMLLFSGDYSDRPADWLAEQSSTVSAPYEIQFSIKSSASKDYVQVAPYLVVEVMSVSDFPTNVMGSDEMGMGGPGQIYEFTGALVPHVGRQHAPMNQPGADEIRDDVDFLSLAPGEVAEVSLSLILHPDLIFRYRVGVPFKYRGRREIHWITHTMQEGLPSVPVAVRRDSRGFTAPEVLPDQASVALVQSYSERNEAWVSRSRVFPP